MERGDTGLGRDAYGPPGRERDRRGYGPGPYPRDEGYSPSEYEEDDPAGSGRPVDVEEDDYGQLLRRPGEMPPRQQRLRQPGRPPPGQPGRFPPGGGPPNGAPPGAGPGHGGVPGNGLPGNGVPHGPVPHGGPAAPPQGGVPHGGPPNGGPCPAAPCPVAARSRAGRSMAGRRTTGRSMAGRCQVGSTGCRTGAGCRRARTAFTGRRDPPHRAGHQAGTTGRVRLRGIRTPIAGAGRLRRRACRRRACRRQAAPFRQDRFLVRRSGVRSPPPLPRYPGYLGLRRRASTRRPDRASMLLTAGSGSARRPNRRGR